MALPTVIAKNQTVLDINIPELGVDIPGSGQYTLTTNSFDRIFSFFEVSNSKTLRDNVVSGDIVINDGTFDLSVSKALSHLEATDATAIHNDVAGEIAAIAAKAVPVAGDFILIEDSTAGNIKKHITIGTLPATDSDAIHDNVSGEIAAIAAKAVPVTGDFLIIEDSAALNVKKSITVGTIPVGGDASGTVITLAVNDLTITSETKGDGLFFDGSGWERLAPGGAGTFLQANGAGAMPTWGTAGGLVNFTEARNTTTENAVVLSPVTTLDNIVFNMGGSAPTWDGFIVGIDSDGTAVGGNARGSGAIELGNAVGRTLATQVASGTRAVIVGGERNTASGLESAVIGGLLNTVSTSYSVVLGGTGNTVSVQGYSGILAGTSNSVTEVQSAIVAGSGNSVTSGYSGILGGFQNLVSGTESACVAGRNSSATNFDSGVFAGNNSDATGVESVVLGGEANLASGANSVVIGGDTCTASGIGASILGTTFATVSGNYCTAIGGSQASIAGSHSGIFAGDDNTIIFSGFAGEGQNVIIGGQFNDAGGLDSSYQAILSGRYNQTVYDCSVAMGAAALSDHPCGFAVSGRTNPSDAERGKSQAQLLHIDGETTAATTVNLASYSPSKTPTPREISFSTGNGCYSYHGTVSAWNETDGTVNSWLVYGTIKNAASTPTLVSSTVTAMAAEHAATLAVSAVAIGGDTDILRFAGTGIAAKTIRWSAAITLSRAYT